MPSPLLRALYACLLAVGCSSSEQGRAPDEPGAAEWRRPAKPLLTPEQLTSPDTSAPPREPVAPQCAQSELVLRPDLSNARDLGGVPLASGTVACGTIFRGPPLRVSARGCEQVAALGLKTVIDLRTESERLAAPESVCVAAEMVTAPLPIPYGLGPADYLLDLNTDESVAKVFHTFGDPSAYPIYFHCTYGRDRTGVIGALLLLTLGAARQTVMDEYLLSAPHVGAYPNALEAVLDEVERRGGAEQVLAELGVTDEEVSVLRARASAK